MSASNRNSRAFGTIELLLFLVVVVVLAGAGWYVWQQHNKGKTNVSSNTSNSHSAPSPLPTPAPGPTITTVSSADGKVQITLPKTWEVIASRSGKQLIDTAADPNCFTATDPSPCVYSASFAPTNYDTTQLWGLSVEKSTRTPQQVIESMLGQVQQTNTIAQSSNPINGYSTYYIEYKHPNTDIYYVIAHHGYIVLFVNSQLNDQSSKDPTLNNPSSPFLTDFTGIVKSIKLSL